MHPIRLRARLATAVAALALAMSSATTAVAVATPALVPAVSDAKFVTASETPPTESACFAVGRRCFTPQAFWASYNLLPLFAAGKDGRAMTVAIVDSWGSDTMAHDLHVFNNAFGLPHMCGEEGVTCTAGMPTFKTLSIQGSQSRVTDLNKQISSFEDRMSLRESTLKSQFSNLEVALGKLKDQQNWLSGQLAGLSQG